MILNPDTRIGSAPVLHVYQMPDEFIVYYDDIKSGSFASLELLFDYLVDVVKTHGVLSAVISDEALAELFIGHEVIEAYSVLLGRSALLFLSSIFSQVDIETILSEIDTGGEIIPLNTGPNTEYIADNRYKGIIN
jgi:hypothetical protein